MSHSRPRSRSRSGPRGNPSPSGDAAETAAEAALVSAAVAVDGLVLYRGDPQQLVAQRTNGTTIRGLSAAIAQRGGCQRAIMA